MCELPFSLFSAGQTDNLPNRSAELQERPNLQEGEADSGPFVLCQEGLQNISTFKCQKKFHLPFRVLLQGLGYGIGRVGPEGDDHAN